MDFMAELAEIATLLQAYANDFDVQVVDMFDEVIAFDDLMAAGSCAAGREKGTLRLEGKEYVVADGDIAHFRFNV